MVLNSFFPLLLKHILLLLVKTVILGSQGGQREVVTHDFGQHGVDRCGSWPQIYLGLNPS